MKDENAGSQPPQAVDDLIQESLALRQHSGDTAEVPTMPDNAPTTVDTITPSPDAPAGKRRQGWPTTLGVGDFPVCPRCRGADTRPSRKRDMAARLIALAGRIPYRCRNCRNRFFRRRPPAVASGPA